MNAAMMGEKKESENLLFIMLIKWKETCYINRIICSVKTNNKAQDYLIRPCSKWSKWFYKKALNLLWGKNFKKCFWVSEHSWGIRKMLEALVLKQWKLKIMDFKKTEDPNLSS